ncbi:metal-sulfur cluster assembly factor [Candidatus Woesearchaeota archaeon]|nr:metal-sulfur cluster assembly factor [Candidatus Woesearchaeota archaeon]
MFIEKEQLISVFRSVEDPELHLDVWTLGLIYDFQIRDKFICVKMTFTSPMCPFGPQILEEIRTKLKSLAPDHAIDIELVFTPPWQPSEELREMLGV